MANTNRRWMMPWTPLDTDPERFNRYMAGLGFETSEYQFVEVISLVDDDYLRTIPTPVEAVVICCAQEMIQNNKKRDKKKRKTTAIQQDLPNDYWFMRDSDVQRSGLDSIFHCIYNLSSNIRERVLNRVSWFTYFYERCPPAMDPLQKSRELDNENYLHHYNNETLRDITISIGDRTLDYTNCYHFRAVVNVNNHVVEFDPYKETPINHGATEAGEFLNNVCEIIRNMPEDLELVVNALVAVPRTEPEEG